MSPHTHIDAELKDLLVFAFVEGTRMHGQDQYLRPHMTLSFENQLYILMVYL